MVINRRSPQVTANNYSTHRHDGEEKHLHINFEKTYKINNLITFK